MIGKMMNHYRKHGYVAKHQDGYAYATKEYRKIQQIQANWLQHTSFFFFFLFSSCSSSVCCCDQRQILTVGQMLVIMQLAGLAVMTPVPTNVGRQ